MPTRNRAVSLAESLKSIRAQTYSPIEILISDNASDDGTETLCRDLAQFDPRIRYVRQPKNIGLHGNHNFCIDESRGEYLCIFHDHDRRDVRIVEEYVNFLAHHSSAGVVCSDWDLIDDFDQTIGVRNQGVEAVTSGLDYITQTIRSGRSSVSLPGAMIRKEALDGARFLQDGPIGFGDFPVWFRLAERADIGHINRTLWSWRQNHQSHSARPIEAIATEYEYNLQCYCDEHLARWPSHVMLVASWKESIRKYLFWALAYEVTLHFRSSPSRGTDAARSLFEIMDYRLTPDQFEHAVGQMKSYRRTPFEYVASIGIDGLIRSRFTSPLGWVSKHQARIRRFLKLA